MAESNSPLNLIEEQRKDAVRKLAEVYLKGAHALYHDLACDGLGAYSGQDWDSFLECLVKAHATIGRHINNITSL